MSFKFDIVLKVIIWPTFVSHCKVLKAGFGFWLVQFLIFAYFILLLNFVLSSFGLTARQDFTPSQSFDKAKTGMH